ncbi:unnamed protein product [Zymoseptoria tritici ST99CH_3D7]|uniref:Uncharacterized protein n=1 Tax=Zymoseptoria tritici (strain ST99CH_3D7) TaxID=1276538 RepID=A0A1X7RTN9_ZYMT9|nr:unnamed protein product [Zymoseptoria tritici ST99CH_3D7]
MTLVIWRQSKPNERRKPGLRELYEKIAAKSAKKLGRTIAEIRAISHPTTKKDDKWVRIQHHMTMNWFYKSTDTASSDGIASSTRSGKQGHCFVDGENVTRMLSSSELDDNTKTADSSAQNVGSNPHTWYLAPPDENSRKRLTYKANEGYANIDCSTL